MVRQISRASHALSLSWIFTTHGGVTEAQEGLEQRSPFNIPHPEVSKLPGTKTSRVLLPQRLHNSRNPPVQWTDTKSQVHQEKSFKPENA